MVKSKSPKYRVLLVDDEDDVRRAVEMTLTVFGDQVESATGGEEALAKFVPSKFDVVIVDFEMPGMKGDQLAAQIKERAPRQPVLMLTAHGEMLRSSGRPVSGVDLIVDKPFRLVELRDAMAKVTLQFSAPPAA